jgi:hypothetical protein
MQPGCVSLSSAAAASASAMRNPAEILVGTVTTLHAATRSLIEFIEFTIDQNLCRRPVSELNGTRGARFLEAPLI